MSLIVRPQPPVTPGTTPEATRLLEYLYEKYGKFTLSGQHNQLHRMSDSSEAVQQVTGKYPAVWGGEWGFSDERHNVDNIAFRPALMEEIYAQHAAGRIVVITYHQANPRVGEPCDFEEGVLGNLTDAEWNDLFTEGTRFRQTWETHVDRLAKALLTLQAKNIPIIFRPYHEMNGGWFWWGGDAERFKQLWTLIYDRYVNHHGLRNLLWAWNPDKPHPGVEDFFPGHETVDLLGTDIYPNADRADTYPQEWYDRMIALTNGKPLALSENSVVPSPADLDRQPWSYWMGWDNLTQTANTNDMLIAAFEDPRVISDRI
jgi:mannan endo-1,4-beta-mannosidase